jgi:formylglycine-generating enzyme required for sulfatase activity
MGLHGVVAANPALRRRATHCGWVAGLLRDTVAGLSIAWMALAPAAAAQRVALLIGNAGYEVGRLTNPPNDLNRMRSALQDVGFQVKVVPEVDQRAMKRAVRDFGESARGAEIALFYFSGHAAQARGENWLIPLRASIERETDYDLEAVSANAVLHQIADAGPRAAIVILDACRDNPVATLKGGPKGLARMDAPTRTMIAFATAPNQTASDNGIYAQVLAGQIRTTGRELLDVFRNTTAEVLRLSQGRQEPRISEVSITDRIYLAGPASGGATVVASGQMPPLTASPERPDLPVFRDCAECPEMVVIPAGSYLMGSPASEEGRYGDEGPQRRVTIDRFAIGKTAVTQGQWKAMMGSNPSEFKECGDDCPVEQVSWNDAQEFTSKLRAKTGQRYVLPSESQWEYAARGGTQTAYPWGDQVGRGLANCDGCGSEWDNKSTAPVKSFAPNRYGIHVNGNVYEWVQDCFDDTAYRKAPSDGRAYEVSGCSSRGLRGGSWNYLPRYARSASRVAYTADYRFHDVGFRVARMLP